MAMYLSEAHEAIRSGAVQAGMQTLVEGLRASRQDHSQPEWRRFVQDVVLTHPVRHSVHADPFTSHAFEKPRGYPGDAVLLDRIYGLLPVPVARDREQDTALEVMRYTTNAPACRAVRYRRRILAEAVDRVGERPDARVLALACGHLREAALVDPGTWTRGTRILAVDQDPLSLEEVGRSYPASSVTPILASVRDLIEGRQRFPNLDLAYAAGLYDYLPYGAARALTRCLFQSLNPGGRLLLANFDHDVADVGYMESLMAWPLIYRNAMEMQALAEALPAAELARVECFQDPDSNLVFLDIIRT